MATITISLLASVSVHAGATMPDCSTSACAATCNCVESKCASLYDPCTADSQCNGILTCMLDCACDDTTCALGCVAGKTLDSVSSEVKTCGTACLSAPEPLPDIPAMPDCSTSACESTCNCVESKCANLYDSCTGDSQCNGILTCMLDCSCDDTTCALGCVAGKTLDSISSEVKTCGTACLSSPEVPTMPDCSTSACESTCNCVESKCANLYESCTGDSQCDGILTCMLDCSCDDTTCALGCVAGKTLDSISSEVKTCGTACLSSPEVPTMPDCTTSGCEATCNCVESKCASLYDPCTADSQCSGILTCMLGCACDDTTCALGCVAGETLDSVSSEVKTCGTACLSLETTV